jgi:formylglycine-generating enzyme required for sulfatase activity
MWWNTAWNASLSADATALRAALKCHPTYQTWTDFAGSAAAESLPIICVNWFEAEAFCIWDGGRLPTEAEWNYAAGGGSEQRTYPWGSTAPDCSFANFRDGVSCAGTGVANRVGSESTKGDGRYGQSDLAGNVWEWTQDWWNGSYPVPCDNCANLTAGTERVLRGGSFDVPASEVQSSHRNLNLPSFHNDFGVRCARTP